MVFTGVWVTACLLKDYLTFSYAFRFLTVLHWIFTQDLEWGDVVIKCILFIDTFFCLCRVIFLSQNDRRRVRSSAEYDLFLYFMKDGLPVILLMHLFVVFLNIPRSSSITSTVVVYFFCFNFQVFVYFYYILWLKCYYLMSLIYLLESVFFFYKPSPLYLVYGSLFFCQFRRQSSCKYLLLWFLLLVLVSVYTIFYNPIFHSIYIFFYEYNILFYNVFLKILSALLLLLLILLSFLAIF